MLDLSIKNQIDPLLKKLASKKSLDVAEELISVILNLIGIKCEKRELLNIPRIDAELPRFELAPGFARQAAAFKIPVEKNNIFDVNFFHIKKVNKTNLSWLVGITPNFEDSEVNELKNIGIDFVIPSDCDGLIILLSNRYKIRSLELKDKIYPTQNEILLSWKNIDVYQKEGEEKLKFLTHKKIWESFNFEPINNKFYLELVEHFSLLVNHLEKKFGRKSSVMFTTRLIGRILFIWFLNKKGLINKDMDYFKVNDPFNQTSYYKNKFEILIFETLNKDVSDRQHKDKTTPYLNGGLFDISETDFYNNNELTFPTSFFNQIYETLNKYNFTVDESSPDFQQVAIDPEMLGRIFESLLSEQVDENTGKSKKQSSGAVYTPREIVNYMCEETIMEFLREKIPFTPDRDRRIEELLRLPESIFRDQDQNKRRDWKPYSEAIIKVLNEDDKNQLKILDPAVGSGAFPIGMLQLLTKIYGRLDPKFEKNIPKLKSLILSKSLYGVDIEQTAVEICRLRAWLSIIVDIKDDDQIEPLPNLEFKFICANSLITFGGANQDQLFYNKDLEIQLGLIRQEYFKINNKQKKRSLQNKYLTLTKNSDLFDDEKTKKLKNYNPFDINSSSDFFDAKIMLGIEKFDIILGNPPYIGQSGNKDIFRLVKSKSILSKYHFGKMDYFYFFYHLALDLIKKPGIIAFITTNYFITAAGAIKLRSDIRQRSRVLKLVNFNEFKIFKNAKGQHNIITILSSEKSPRIETLASLSITSYKGDSQTDKLNEILYKKDNDTFYTSVESDKVFDGDNNYIRFFDQAGENSINSLLEKIKEKSKPLAYYCEVFQGLISGCDFVSNRNISKIKNLENIKNKDGIFVLDLSNPRDVEVINSFSKNEKLILKPFYKNSDIYHYSCSQKPSKYVLYITSEKHKLENLPNIKKHLNKFRDILNEREDVVNKRIEWFDLNRTRNEHLFLGEKIVVPYRASKNFFGYTNADWFCRSDVYLIKPRSKSFKNMLALTGFLNSSLMLFWLKYKGKKKGEILELFPDFLNEIPILIDNKIIVNKIEKIVSMALKDKDRNRENITNFDLKNKIDNLIYKSYDLTFEEVKKIDPNFKLTISEYKALEI